MTQGNDVPQQNTHTDITIIRKKGISKWIIHMHILYRNLSTNKSNTSTFLTNFLKRSVIVTINVTPLCHLIIIIIITIIYP